MRQGRHGNEASHYPSRVSYGGEGGTQGKFPPPNICAVLSVQILVTTKVVYRGSPTQVMSSMTRGPDCQVDC